MAYVIEAALEVYNIEEELTNLTGKIIVNSKQDAIQKLAELMHYGYDSFKCYQISNNEIENVLTCRNNTVEIYNKTENVIPLSYYVNRIKY